ncbi:hypothetical protein NQ317_016815 [Molorchus minor]|uniref:Uncharacterized protein n=1 Tax=Molorchus minor TaxID=1323400 RepID=A0ABQ9JFZ6_9CUCU|nr:hypothetical protein NQ317_016815 [Molorchus minor]
MWKDTKHGVSIFREGSDKIGKIRECSDHSRNSRNRFLESENIRKDIKHSGFRPQENSGKVGRARIVSGIVAIVSPYLKIRECSDHSRNSRNRFLESENIRKDIKHGGFRLQENSGKVGRARIVSGIVAIVSPYLKICGKTPNTVFLSFGRDTVFENLKLSSLVPVPPMLQGFMPQKYPFTPIRSYWVFLASLKDHAGPFRSCRYANLARGGRIKFMMTVSRCALCPLRLGQWSAAGLRLSAERVICDFSLLPAPRWHSSVFSGAEIRRGTVPQPRVCESHLQCPSKLRDPDFEVSWKKLIYLTSTNVRIFSHNTGGPSSFQSPLYANNSLNIRRRASVEVSKIAKKIGGDDPLKKSRPERLYKPPLPPVGGLFFGTLFPVDAVLFKAVLLF